MGGIVRLQLRCTKPQNTVDTAQQRDHELQLRFGVAFAERAAPGGFGTLDGASYTYDFAGNRTSKTNYLNGTTWNYGYDPLFLGSC